MVLSMQSGFESQMGGGARVPAKTSNWNGLGKNPKWSELLSVDKDVEIHDPLVYETPTMVDGAKMMVFSEQEIEKDVQNCENLVIGCFVGKRLAFQLVRNTVKRVWKVKNDFKMTLHDDSIFVFEFDSEEDRASSLEHGCFFIAGQLFVVRPWTLLIEQELSELKTIHVWVNLRKVPLHLWNAKGLGKLASFIGVPLMLDKKTASRSKMAYARICVEIGVDSDFPPHIDALAGNVKIQVPVEYSWRPPRCQHCNVFGHTQSKCSAAAVAAKSASASKLVLQTSALKEKVIEYNGWQVKNLKRSRGKNGGKTDETMREGANGASSSKSMETESTSIPTQNKFHYLEGENTDMNIEIPVHGAKEDNILKEIGGNNENEMVMEVVMTSGDQQKGKEFPTKFGTHNVGFVLTQVEKIDDGQKGEEGDGARAHFLSKSAGVGKPSLGVKEQVDLLKEKNQTPQI